MKGVKTTTTRQDILAAIHRLAQKLGRTPTKEELERLGGILGSAVRREFYSYRSAVRAAGLEPAPRGKRNFTNRQMLEDWGEVARKLGKTPTQVEYDDAGQYSSQALVARFEGWSTIPAAFVKSVTGDEWRDVVEIAQSSAPRTWSERMRGARGLSRTTVEKTKRAMARYTMPRNAGTPAALTGRTCVTAAMLPMLVASIVLGGGFLRRVLPDRPLLGPPMHEATLAHEPVNEMGVAMLFAMVAPKLGFIIESVQAPFPDCRAKMEVLPGRWQDIRIEFEKESRNFAEHKHDPNGADMIVCWKHNWKACPPGMMVLELSRIFGNREI